MIEKEAERFYQWKVVQRMFREWAAFSVRRSSRRMGALIAYRHRAKTIVKDSLGAWRAVVLAAMDTATVMETIKATATTIETTKTKTTVETLEGRTGMLSEEVAQTTSEERANHFSEGRAEKMVVLRPYKEAWSASRRMGKFRRVSTSRESLAKAYRFAARHLLMRCWRKWQEQNSKHETARRFRCAKLLQYAFRKIVDNAVEERREFEAECRARRCRYYRRLRVSFAGLCTNVAARRRARALCALQEWRRGIQAAWVAQHDQGPAMAKE